MISKKVAKDAKKVLDSKKSSAMEKRLATGALKLKINPKLKNKDNGK